MAFELGFKEREYYFNNRIGQAEETAFLQHIVRHTWNRHITVTRFRGEKGSGVEFHSVSPRVGKLLISLPRSLLPVSPYPFPSHFHVTKLHRKKQIKVQKRAVCDLELINWGRGSASVSFL